ncbi:MAG: Jag N-terminal domain-containing protein [Clostridia bacterium]|nr:Jag N-terminal domain-containing protein [Clostridia bacterium]
MLKSIISEGKTTNEAIENGLKKLNVSKNDVEIKVLESTEKRSFFSILTPRVVKVELKIKEKEEKKENNVNTKKEEKNITNIEERKIIVEDFLKKFIEKLPDNEIQYKINIVNNEILLELNGGYAGKLIGYRGESLNSMQTILSSIVNKNFEDRVKVLLDIEGYREKREKTLEELAIKISKTVIKTGKSITLEPMSAYERKIIHSKLQEYSNIDTHSTGEEPNRRIVISKK